MADENGDENDIDETMSEFRSRYQGEGEHEDEEDGGDSTESTDSDVSDERDSETHEEDEPEGEDGAPEEPPERDEDDDVTSSVVGKRLGEPEGGLGRGLEDLDEGTEDDGDDDWDDGLDEVRFTTGSGNAEEKPDESKPTEEAGPAEPETGVVGSEPGDDAVEEDPPSTFEPKSSPSGSSDAEGEAGMDDGEDEESGFPPEAKGFDDSSPRPDPEGGSSPDDRRVSPGENLPSSRPEAEDEQEPEQPGDGETDPGRTEPPEEGAGVAEGDFEPDPSHEDRSDVSSLETSTPPTPIEDSPPDEPETTDRETSFSTGSEGEQPDTGGSAGSGMGSRVSRILARILVIGAILAFFWFVGGKGRASNEDENEHEDPGEAPEDRTR